MRLFLTIICLTFMLLSSAQKAGPKINGWTTIAELEPAGFSTKYYNLIGKYSYFMAMAKMNFGVYNDNNEFFNKLKLKVWSFDNESFELKEPQDAKYPGGKSILHNSTIINDTLYLFVAEKISAISFKVYSTRVEKPGKWKSKDLVGYKEVDGYQYKSIKHCLSKDAMHIAELYGDSLFVSNYDYKGGFESKLSIGDLSNHSFIRISRKQDFFCALTLQNGDYYLHVFNQSNRYSNKIFSADDNIKEFDVNLIDEMAVISCLIENTERAISGFRQINLTLSNSELEVFDFPINSDIYSNGIIKSLDGWGVKKLDLDDYHLAGTIVDESNNIHLVASQYKRVLNVNVTSYTPGPTGMGMGSSASAKTEYLNGNIITLKTTASGTEKGQCLIPKRSPEGTSPGLDYFVYLSSSNLKFLYHDHLKNPRSGYPEKKLKKARGKKAPLTYVSTNPENGTYQKEETVNYIIKGMVFDMINPYYKDNKLIVFGSRHKFPKIAPIHQLATIPLK